MRLTEAITLADGRSRHYIPPLFLLLPFPQLEKTHVLSLPCPYFTSDGIALLLLLQRHMALFAELHDMSLPHNSLGSKDLIMLVLNCATLSTEALGNKKWGWQNCIKGWNMPVAASATL